jgi:hypothetical protein
MSDDAPLANRLFGGTPEPPPGGDTGRLMAWADKTNQKQSEPLTRDEGSVVDDKVAGETLYGGDTLDSYEPFISPVLEQEAHKARFDGNHEEAMTIDKASRELNTVFKEYEVSGIVSKEIMVEAGNYLSNPRSEEAIIHAEDETRTVLAEKYGDDLDKNLAGARRVVNEIGKRVPNFIHVLERTGLGNSQKVIEGCIQIARKKGYVK